jgi:SSS family solute:Na+ symporter
MFNFLWSLLAFGFYTFALLLLTGQTFSWKETRRTFYVGSRRYGALSSLMTFCATWMSAASLVGFILWMMRDGYVAFSSSVLGWMLGLVPMPFLVYRLRKRRSVSIPEWLSAEYGDHRWRFLGGLAILFSYSVYLVIQFRAFGEIVSYMLQIPLGFSATALVYLFVLYTTFGGYPSVVRSDALNFCLIAAGVTIAFISAVSAYGTPLAAHRQIAETSPVMLDSWHSGVSTFAMVMSWGLGVASNPQYSIRLMAVRTTSDAMKVIFGAPFVIGWIYFAATNLGLILSAFKPLSIPMPLGSADFPSFFSQALPIWGSLPLLIAILAAVVSTANSELLIATSALCNDLRFSARKSNAQDSPFVDKKFLQENRVAVVFIASVSLLMSQIPLPEILTIGRMSWTVFAVCFFFPLYFRFDGDRARKKIFMAVSVSLAMHAVTSIFTPLSVEISMLVQIGAQAIYFMGIRKS